jgi:hypothetical protein
MNLNIWVQRGIRYTIYSRSDHEIYIDLSEVKMRHAIPEAMTRPLLILCTFSKVKIVQDGRHVSIRISEHNGENRLKIQTSTVVEQFA